MQYRKDVQGLRAIAFLLVFIFHLNSNFLSGGFVGVDVFFVISGFLITSIILTEKEKGTFNLIQFYEKRIKRIAPVYFFVLFSVGIVACLIFYEVELVRFRQLLIADSVFLSNVYLSRIDDYFGTTAKENPLLHTWTLAIEMQFYLFLPLLLLWLKRKYLNHFILVYIFIAVIYCEYQMMNMNKTQQYFSLLARSPEFLIGSLLAINKEKLTQKLQSPLFAYAGIVLIICCAILLDNKTPFPGIIALIPCLGAFLLISSTNNSISQLLSIKPMVYIGELSYSLYLWHWPIMGFMRYKNDQIDFNESQINVIILLTLSLSILSYYFIEKRFIQINGARFRKGFLLYTTAIVLFLIFTPYLSIHRDIPIHFQQSVEGIPSKDNGIQVLNDIEQPRLKISFIGNSHGLNLISFMDQISKSNGYKTYAVTNLGIPPIPGIEEMDKPLRKIKNHKDAVSKLKYAKKIIDSSDLIVLTIGDIQTIPKYINVLQYLTQQTDQKIILLKSFPYIKKDFLKTEKKIHVKHFTDTSLTIPYELPREIEKFIQTSDRLFIFDLSQSTVFKYAPYYKDTLIYYDKKHINDWGARALGKDLEKEFREFIEDLLNEIPNNVVHQSRT